MLPWQQLKVRGLNNDFFQKKILNFDFRNGIKKYQLVILPIFAMFHPQTTEIQPFKGECFFTKALQLQKAQSD